jgi:hypothetical protein
MKQRLATWKSVVLTFCLALVFYVLAWSWMARKQTGKGPWQVEFTTNGMGVPQLVISQPALGLSNVTVRFEQERLAPTNGVGAVAFLQPRMTVPYGRVIYDDLMFQPGSVALDCFGHVVEMVPRDLILNGSPVPWRSNSEHPLLPTNKIPAEVRKKWKGGYK